MQPKHLPMYQRLKHEPSVVHVTGSYRLWGQDFHSVAAAARELNISYSWAREQIINKRNVDAPPTLEKHKNAAWKETYYDLSR
jgi:L-arabinose isomerase